MNTSDNHIDLTKDYDNPDCNDNGDRVSSKMLTRRTAQLPATDSYFHSYNAEHYHRDSDSEDESSDDPNLDSIVSSVIRKFAERSRVGLEKYGTDLDREDLTFLDWVRHAQEEHMDAILYLEKIKKTEETRLASTSSESVVYLYLTIYALTVSCLVMAMGYLTERLPIV